MRKVIQRVKSAFTANNDKIADYDRTVRKPLIYVGSIALFSCILLGVIFSLRNYEVVFTCFALMLLLIYAVYLTSTEHFNSSGMILYLAGCAAIYLFAPSDPELFTLMVPLSVLIIKGKMQLIIAFSIGIIVACLKCRNLNGFMVFATQQHLIYSLIVLTLTYTLCACYVNLYSLYASIVRKNSTLKYFLASTNHELRNTIGVIDQATYTLRHVKIGNDFKEVFDKAYQLINILVVASNNLRQTIESSNGLTLDRIEAGESKKEPQVIVVSEDFFQESCKIRSLEAELHNIRLKVAISGMPKKILVYPQALHRIIDNLLSNAIKFNYPGGAVLIEVFKNDSSTFTIQVDNTGPGIPSDKLGLIWRPFYSTSLMEGGMGVGLSIVEQDVEKIGGTVTVDSIPFHNTTFTVVAPLHSYEREEALEMSVINPDLTGKHVLIADDHRLSSLMLSMHFEKLGARVSRVIDGYEVLQKMNEDRPDLIILDCQLPRLDGRSTLKSLMQDTSAVPVIAISGLELQDPVLDEMIVLGAAGVMEKPLDPTSLNKTLNEIFRM